MPSNHCDKVGQCKNSWWCAIDYNPTNKDCFDQMTIGDSIRSLPDEGLADVLAKIANHSLPTVYTSDGLCLYEGKWSCEDWLKWLQKPLTEEKE